MPPAVPVNNEWLAGTTQADELARIHATNGWLRGLRWDRERAWDDLNEAEAAYRLRRPQAVPTPGYRLTRLDTALMGLAVGLTAWLAFGLTTVAPAVNGGLR